MKTKLVRPSTELSNELTAAQARIAELDDQLSNIKAAFDDRVRIIELQLKDKEELRQSLTDKDKEIERLLTRLKEIGFI